MARVDPSGNALTKYNIRNPLIARVGGPSDPGTMNSEFSMTVMSSGLPRRVKLSGGLRDTASFYYEHWPPMIRPKSGDHQSKTMSPKRVFTPEKAKEIGETLGVDWTKFDVEQFRVGMDVELEHGTEDPNTNVTNDDPLMTGKIALAHLNEFPDYYTRLLELEEEAEEYWENR